MTLMIRSAARAAASLPSMGRSSRANGRRPRAGPADRLPRRAPEPRRRLLDHLVAHGMTQRVVDGLEVVEVDIEHRRLFAALERRLGLGHLLEKFDAVGQIGQRIVPRQVLDARLVLPLLVMSLMGGHPAAILHRMVLPS